MEKTKALFKLISQEIDINKIYLYAKDSNEGKHQLLINKIENSGLKLCNDSKIFVEYWNDIDDICKNIEEYNPN